MLSDMIFPGEVNMDWRQSYKYLNSLSNDPDNSCYVEKKRTFSNAYDLSVIVPAYNVENYIEKCINSIIGQNTTYSF